MDLAAIGRGGEQIVTTLPWGLLWYPQSLEIPLAIGVLVLDNRAGVGVAATRCADATARRSVGGRFGCSACGRRRCQLRGVAIGAADRPRTGFCRGRGAVPARALPAGDAARRIGRRPLGVCAGTSMVGCRRPRRRHARLARPCRRSSRVHAARHLRGRGAAGVGRGHRCSRCGAASGASYGCP